jgi:hypothetical protein
MKAARFESAKTLFLVKNARSSIGLRVWISQYVKKIMPANP